MKKFIITISVSVVIAISILVAFSDIHKRIGFAQTAAAIGTGWTILLSFIYSDLHDKKEKAEKKLLDAKWDLIYDLENQIVERLLQKDILGGNALVESFQMLFLRKLIGTVNPQDKEKFKHYVTNQFRLTTGQLCELMSRAVGSLDHELVGFLVQQPGVTERGNIDISNYFHQLAEMSIGASTNYSFLTTLLVLVLGGADNLREYRNLRSLLPIDLFRKNGKIETGIRADFIEEILWILNPETTVEQIAKADLKYTPLNNSLLDGIMKKPAAETSENSKEETSAE